jgi:hypothetical protein
MGILEIKFMKLKLSAVVAMVFSVHTLTGGELEEFLADESERLKDRGKNYSLVVELDRIKNEKNRERALELALSYVRGAYRQVSKELKDRQERVKYIEILIEFDNEEAISAGREFLFEMFTEGSISEIAAVDSGFKVKVKSEATGKLSKILVGNGRKYRAVALILGQNSSVEE